MRYHVYVNAVAHVRATITVDAPTKADAKVKALGMLGDADWTYDGLSDSDSPDVSGADPVEHPPIPVGCARCDNCQRDFPVGELAAAPDRGSSWAAVRTPQGVCPACGGFAFFG